MKFADHPTTWEDDWQELVVAHLGLEDWTRVQVTDQLDTLGSIATEALRRHGHFWPSNTHSVMFLAREAGGGSLLTGGGGDELLRSWGWMRPPSRTLLGLRPRRRLLKWGGYYALPFRLRRRVRVKPFRIFLPWLTPHGQALLDQAAQDPLPAPRSWSEDLERYLAGRYLECVRSSLDTFAASEGLHLVEPFYVPRVVRAVAASAPWKGFASRTEAFELLFSDLLPAKVLRRSTKAHFMAAFWGPVARDFVEGWDGTGIDAEIADIGLLTDQWRREVPDVRAATPLHAAWLAASPQAVSAIASS